jgi:trimethylamine--corrinoid protein Co-methyltransferase
MDRLKFLSEEEVEAIHIATLRVLDGTGVLLSHPVACEILSGAGARVDNGRVYLPPDLVETEVAKTTGQVTIRGRGSAITLGDGSLHWHNMGGARDVFDPRTGQARPATLQDVRDSTLILDAMPQVTTITPLFTPRDVPGHLMSLAMYRYALPCTVKPLQGPGVASAEEVHVAVEMAEVIGPPQETLSLAVSPVSPLTFPDSAVSAMIAIAEAGVPFLPLPCPTAGSTAPMSLAGALVQQNAENLAAIALAQLIQPGLPVAYCGRLAMMEPRTGSSVWGGVELGLASAGTVQIGHRYRLPVNVYGFSTNSYLTDSQNGFERALNAAIPALAGADELSGIGELGAGTISSLQQIVIDNEFAASIRRAVRGFNADADALAVDVIHAAMGNVRNFLAERHSIRYLRGGEMLQTKLAERRSWNEWDNAGRISMADRAQVEAERLLREHEVPPLAPEQEQTLDEILQAADRTLSRLDH